MMKVGITGGIGSGKSTVCRLFAQKGVAVYDSDAEAKRLMTSSEALRAGIVARFGAESYRGGELNRAWLADRVFRDDALCARADFTLVNILEEELEPNVALLDRRFRHEAQHAGH